MKEELPTMTAAPNAALLPRLSALAATHGVQIVSSEPATSFAGAPTTRFQLGLGDAPGTVMQLELSDDFDVDRKEFAEQLNIFLADAAKRLKTPRPDALLTLGGIPLSYSSFAWPFHESTAGADTSLVHGQVKLEDGQGSPLHAKIAAAMTTTFREVVRAPEQPFSESFILNAVRKTFDQGQLELVKSGNRQPVPVTTRYYSAKQNKFIFNDTTEPERKQFLAAKTYWLSGVLGGGGLVWLTDPRDAQYLNTTVPELKAKAATLAQEGLVQLSPDGEFATATAALMGRAEEFEAQLAEALAFIKPTFNEEMRGGHTNM